MATALTVGELRQGVTAWAKQDLNRTLRVAGISFAVSWLVNFFVITTWGAAAVGNLVGGASEGAEVKGTVYMAIMSLVVTSLVVYGMEAGWSDLRQSFTALPGAVGRMFRQYGVRMWSIVFWGGAVTLLTSGILSPTISAALGLGFLAFAPTAITGLLGKVITSIWSTLIGFFAPKRRPRPPGLGGQMIAMVGSAVGFLVASQATETAFKLIAAAVLAGLSYLVVTNATSRTAKAGALVLVGLAFWIIGDGIAAALGVEGCCGEDHHHPMEAGAKAAGLSTVAGVAGGVAGVIGAGVGSVLASHPTNPSTWDDGEGARVTSDPIPAGPTRTTTVTLTGDEARAALDAYRRANSEGGQADIPLPESEQWEVFVSDADGNKVTSGHMGTRGRVTNIGGVVEGEDGSIAISVDVTTYSPTAAAAAPPPASAPPAGVPGTAAAGTAGAAGAAGTAGAGAGGGGAPPADPATAGDDADAPPAPPPPPGLPDPGPVIEATTVPPPIEAAPPTAATPAQTPPAEVPPPAGRSPDPVLDGSDPGAYADWVGRAAGRHLPPPDVAAIQGMIRGDSDAITISGGFTGPFAPLLRDTESRTDGVAIKFPTGDRILVRVRDGRVEIKHEASLFGVIADSLADSAAEVGLKIPKIEDAITAAAAPVESFNRAVDTTGRSVESVSRNPDGSITVRLAR